jgi:hypothetical protein
MRRRETWTALAPTTSLDDHADDAQPDQLED